METAPNQGVHQEKQDAGPLALGRLHTPPIGMLEGNLECADAKNPGISCRITWNREGVMVGRKNGRRRTLLPVSRRHVQHDFQAAQASVMVGRAGQGAQILEDLGKVSPAWTLRIEDHPQSSAADGLPDA
jgi:hypothetical protein